jgi:hypothetical protein
MSKTSNEQRKAEVTEAFDRLQGHITTAAEDGSWLELMSQLARFHDYSVNNTIWMMLQAYDRGESLSLPGSKSTWDGVLGKGCTPKECKCGRTDGKHDGWIKKGSKAYSVLAPVLVNKKDDNGNPVVTAAGKPAKKLVGFKLVRRTFDASQIVGGTEFVAALSRSTLLEGVGDDEARCKLVALAERIGFTVQYEEGAGMAANGWCSHSANTIQVHTDGRSLTQQLKTLAHEVAHALMHGDEDRGTLSGAEKEVEAESVAFVVMNALGIDSQDYSVGYVATWAAREDGAKSLTKTAGRIKATAEAVIGWLEDGTWDGLTVQAGQGSEEPADLVGAVA